MNKGRILREYAILLKFDCLYGGCDCFSRQAQAPWLRNNLFDQCFCSADLEGTSAA